MRNVIIGGGPAGYHAAIALRSAGQDVTLVNLENEPFYSRVLISHYLGDIKPRENVYLDGLNCYKRMGVATRLGRYVVSVDAKEKNVTLDDGEVLSYDNLLVASGSEPAVPPIPGRDLPGTFTFYTLKDADAIKSWVRPGEPVVVIGGGLVAIKGLESLLEMDVQVHLVELMDQVLPQVLDASAAAILQDAMKDHGIKLYLKNSVAAIEGNGRVESVRLNDGTVIPCHLVLIATGVRPCLKFMEGTGVEINRGIVVDEYMQTNIPGIYAAGDAAEAYDVAYGEKKVNALWPVAVAQGRTAGLNMAGQKTVYVGAIGMNTLEMLGLRFVSFGQIRASQGCQEDIVMQPDKPYYRKLVYQGNIIKGGVIVNDIEGAGILYWMARSRFAVDNIAELNALSAKKMGYIRELNKKMTARASSSI